MAAISGASFPSNEALCACQYSHLTAHERRNAVLFACQEMIKMNEDPPNLGNEVISHRALVRAHQRLEMALMQNGHNIAIYGDYGVGKTTLLRSFMDEQKRIQRSAPTESPVLSVPVPFRPTITSLAQRILCELGVPYAARSTEAITCDRLVGAMRYAGIQLGLTYTVRCLLGR